jgi:nitrogen regulatory protein P-II 2
MHTTTLHLVTIIAEPVLEEKLTRVFRQLGARGFTVTESRGEGSRGIRAVDVPGQNVRIEVIVSPAVGDAILEHIAVHYFPHYAVIAFRGSVEVVRGEKYV